MENVLWSDESKADFLDATTLIMSGGKQTRHSTVKAIVPADLLELQLHDRDALVRLIRTELQQD